jgi:hypothetical protein
VEENTGSHEASALIPRSGRSAASQATHLSKYGRASAARSSSMGKTGSERETVLVTPRRVAVIVTDPVVSIEAGLATTQTSPTVPGASRPAGSRRQAFVAWPRS